MSAEDIARQVLRAFFGDEGSFANMTSTAERRAAVKAVREALEKSKSSPD